MSDSLTIDQDQIRVINERLGGLQYLKVESMGHVSARAHFQLMNHNQARPISELLHRQPDGQILSIFLNLLQIDPNRRRNPFKSDMGAYYDSSWESRCQTISDVHGIIHLYQLGMRIHQNW